MNTEVWFEIEVTQQGSSDWYFHSKFMEPEDVAVEIVASLNASSEVYEYRAVKVTLTREALPVGA